MYITINNDAYCLGHAQVRLIDEFLLFKNEVWPIEYAQYDVVDSAKIKAALKGHSRMIIIHDTLCWADEVDIL
jgi:hypothetical protein